MNADLLKAMNKSKSVLNSFVCMYRLSFFKVNRSWCFNKEWKKLRIAEKVFILFQPYF